MQPSLKGQLDRFGGAPAGSVRYMIGPYLPYQKLEDLKPIHECAVKRQKDPGYYRCFVSDDGTGGMVAPPGPKKSSKRKAR